MYEQTQLSSRSITPSASVRGAAANNSGVRTRHPDYDEMVERWSRCEDAAEGEYCIHKAGAKYLPKLKEETSDDYTARLKRTPFFNAVWRTISGLKGMLFRKDPTLVIPESVKPFLDDVDMAGTPFTIFAQDLAEDLLTVGRIGVLVDRPPMPVNSDGSALTVAQAESLGLRPTMQTYDADEIINWKTSRIGNAVKLTLVVLCEEADILSSQFDQATEPRYRVLDLLNGIYRQRVFRINEKNEDEQVGEDIFPLMNGRPMDSIPFVFFGVDDVGPDIDSPPLLDLVDMNIHHYQVSADYEHACHFSGLPTLFITGYRPETIEGGGERKIYIGGSSANCLPDPNSKAFYAETAGDFTALANNLTQKKAEMAVLGARMLEQQQKGVQSADTIRERAAGEQSQLAGMAAIMSQAMTQCLRIFSEWAGASGDVSYEVNREFTVAGVTAQDLTAMVAAWQAGMPGASGQNVYTWMQNKEFADPAISYEEEQARIASGSPIAPTGV